MEIKNTAMAGTLESSDISITIEANDNGIEINLKSSQRYKKYRILQTFLGTISYHELR